MVQANPASGGTVLYGYDTRNHRIYKGAYDGAYYSSEEIYFYGVDGHKYGTWIVNAFSQHPLTLITTKQWFGARLVSPEDRLGSKGKYFAYGEERTNVSPANPSNDQEKFATYTRDAATGLDYADQRYYSSLMGRFTTPDAYQARNALVLPANWNRYAYVGDDPANKNDPSGACSPSDNPPCYSAEGIGHPDVDPDGGGGGGGLGGPRLRPILPPPDWNTADPPPNPLPESSADCSLKLEYRQAALTGRSHSALVVGDEHGYTFTIEGFPQHYPLPPWGNLEVQNTPGDINNQQWGQTLTSSIDPGLCEGVDLIEYAESFYSANKITYYPWGPNSNSLIHWLLQSGYVDRYFTAPPQTVGWDTRLYF